MPRNKERQKKRRERKAELKARGHVPMKCAALTKKGTACPGWRAIVVIDNKHYRAKTCYAHLPDSVALRAGMPTRAEREAFIKSQGKKGGRPPTKPHAVLKKMVEAEVEEWIKPFKDALQATKPVVVGNGPTARVELLADDRARMQAANDVFDRVYGKPKQTVEGAFDIETVQHVEVPTGPEREQEVAKILAESGALNLATIVAQSSNPVNQN